MTGASRPGLRKPDVGGLATTLRRRVALLVLPLAGLALVASACGFEPADSGGLPVGDETSSSATNTELSCGGSVTPDAEPTRHINLVLDDSQSLFFDGEKEGDDSWSFAKYSLEVLAAMMGTEDTMDIYLLGDFAGGENPPTTHNLSSGMSDVDRVSYVHGMQLRGGTTPYQRLLLAANNLEKVQAEEKWLVILSDKGNFLEFEPQPNGKFKSSQVPPATVDGALKDYAKTGIKIAALTLEGEQPTVKADEDAGIYSAVAADASELIAGMTDFANIIFDRTQLDPAKLSGGSWSTDIPMEEVVVFAQGSGVEIGAAQTASGSVAPTSSVSVKWSENKSIEGSQPKPNTSLEGVIATFPEIPKGDITFDIPTNVNLDVFYKPKVSFGVLVRGESGEQVNNRDIKAGDTYVVDYGFMDENCQIINSPLLEPVAYTAVVSTKDRETGQQKIVEESFEPGQSLTFPDGDVNLGVTAVFPGGTAVADVPISVGAASSCSAIGTTTFNVTDLSTFPSEADGVLLEYTIGKGVQKRTPTADEWAKFNVEAVQVESQSNIEFVVRKGSVPGVLILLPRAPDGDIWAADTGKITVNLTAPTIVGVKGSAPCADVPFEIVDDKTGVFLHWLKTWGWKLALLLLLLAIIIGYIIKPRFPRLQNNPPAVLCSPKRFGRQPNDGFGRFVRSGWRRMLPYVADRATLTPWDTSDGAAFFVPLKLQAKRGKIAEVSNYKVIAQRAELDGPKYFCFINGQLIDDTIKRAPRVGRGAVIESESPECTDSCTPF